MNIVNKAVNDYGKINMEKVYRSRLYYLYTIAFFSFLLSFELK